MTTHPTEIIGFSPFLNYTCFLCFSGFVCVEIMIIVWHRKLLQQQTLDRIASWSAFISRCTCDLFVLFGRSSKCIADLTLDWDVLNVLLMNSSSSPTLSNRLRNSEQDELGGLIWVVIRNNQYSGFRRVPTTRPWSFGEQQESWSWSLWV